MSLAESNGIKCRFWITENIWFRLVFWSLNSGSSFTSVFEKHLQLIFPSGLLRDTEDGTQWPLAWCQVGLSRSFTSFMSVPNRSIDIQCGRLTIHPVTLSVVSLLLASAQNTFYAENFTSPLKNCSFPRLIEFFMMMYSNVCLL